ncbi:hypothetical protein CY34DRAFT_206298 [Suillus luteus UH-Slu-Lm8-n1]|uniref:Unplaced genomic scaffold CY34scaffold_138, whole genome shotgun sequence n=1 Tax=Suillus luteus UH-Slu-Lm8-n1 TaxID=930992 RepID=A0A0D0B4N4_9AGAM|nr:hypothetical protein CY34DRAFT_206298 [Suillus luteus UH-Slu-Lm8-n1]
MIDRFRAALFPRGCIFDSDICTSLNWNTPNSLLIFIVHLPNLLACGMILVTGTAMGYIFKLQSYQPPLSHPVQQMFDSLSRENDTQRPVYAVDHCSLEMGPWRTAAELARHSRFAPSSSPSTQHHYTMKPLTHLCSKSNRS